MQWVVRLFAWVMMRAMRTSGAESLSASANIFVGQTEAPLLIRPYVKTMTRSELMAVMTGGFATIAGGVMAAYVGLLSARWPDIAGHLLAASVMSAPAALVMAKMMLPETEQSLTAGTVRVEAERPVGQRHRRRRRGRRRRSSARAQRGGDAARLPRSDRARECRAGLAGRAWSGSRGHARGRSSVRSCVRWHG